MRFEHKLIRNLDRLDEQMAALPKKGEEYKKLAQRREKMCYNYAKALLSLDPADELNDPDPENQYDVGGRLMRPCWKVTGSPSKKERDAATTWMRNRNPEWNGSTAAIRREIAATLNGSNEALPSSFGFGIRLTVECRVFKVDPWFYNQPFATEFKPGKSIYDVDTPDDN
jgi:hypothetical protein